jgi:hypothetical protein
MSIDQANIRMLRAVSQSFFEQAIRVGSGANARRPFAPMLSALCTCVHEALDRAADDLEQNPIRLTGEAERLDNPEA